MNGHATAEDLAPARASTKLTILFDERCTFCLRCRDWLADQPVLVEVELMASGSPTAHARYGALPWLGNELVVVDERGQAWVGPAAFLMCLWATARSRPWSYVLSRPGFSRFTSRFFMHVSKRRESLSSWLARGDDGDDCSWCDEVKLRWDP